LFYHQQWEDAKKEVYLFFFKPLCDRILNQVGESMKEIENLIKKYFVFKDFNEFHKEICLNEQLVLKICAYNLSDMNTITLNNYLIENKDKLINKFQKDLEYAEECTEVFFNDKFFTLYTTEKFYDLCMASYEENENPKETMFDIFCTTFFTNEEKIVLIDKALSFFREYYDSKYFLNKHNFFSCLLLNLDFKYTLHLVLENKEFFNYLMNPFIDVYLNMYMFEKFNILLKEDKEIMQDSINDLDDYFSEHEKNQIINKLLINYTLKEDINEEEYDGIEQLNDFADDSEFRKEVITYYKENLTEDVDMEVNSINKLYRLLLDEYLMLYGKGDEAVDFILNACFNYEYINKKIALKYFDHNLTREDFANLSLILLSDYYAFNLENEYTKYITMHSNKENIEALLKDEDFKIETLKSYALRNKRKLEPNKEKVLKKVNPFYVLDSPYYKNV
jgi:hypothetical protein